MSANQTRNETNTNETRTTLRRRLTLAVALLCFTLLGGWAAGKAGAPIPGVGATPLHATAGNVHFRGQLDRTSVLQGSDGVFGVELVLSADELPDVGRVRIPTDLVVVLDRSGSMQGKPLQDAISSIRELVSRLAPDDRFALVTYSSDVQLQIPLQAATPGNRDRWSHTVSAIGPGGGTNMAIGIDLASQTVAGARAPGRMPRVIVLSDGHANEGDHSREGLRARAARAVAGEYVLSTVGVGQGFDEALMTALADAGTGNFYYVQDGNDLGDVFAGEFDSARETVAKAVTVELDLGPGVAVVDAAGYPVERAGRIARFHPGTLFAGQERRIWLTLRAPTSDVGDIDLGEFRMTYRDPNASLDARPEVLRFSESPQLACVADEAVFAASMDKDLVVRGILEDGLSALKQSVAASVQRGDYDDAQQKIEFYRARNQADYGRLGLVQEQQDSFTQTLEMEEEIKRAFASPAAPAARNALSKTLASEGQDGRRQGAKKGAKTTTK
jgi:Ca-activated chloride channel family protein